jgi:hypothetical protein
MNKKYQVFVSSTYEDLKDERLAVINILLDNNCIPVGMEQFPASGLGVMEYISKVIDDCDYYVLIIAGRYGSIDTDGVSFTEKEFDYAKSKGIPILAFYYKEPGSLLASKCETSDNGRRKLESFRLKAQKGTLARSYLSIDDLKAHVATSINKAIQDTPAPGWIRATSIQDPPYTAISDKNDHYSIENVGSFTPAGMKNISMSLFMGVDWSVNINIIVGNDYLVSIRDQNYEAIQIGYISNISFFPTTILPEQFFINTISLHIKSGDAIIWKSNDRYIIIQLVQTWDSIEKFQGRFAIYAKPNYAYTYTDEIKKLKSEIASLKTEIDNQPKIHFGTTEPSDLNNGDIYFSLE